MLKNCTNNFPSTYKWDKTPAHSVKYLEVLVNEHLKWTKQLTQIKIKLNPAIGILSKLRNITNHITP